nr:DoxX family protein [Thermoleophilaceae bacterium]
MRRVAKGFAGPGLVVAGLNHFLMPKTYEAIMPDYLPAHRELV